MSAPSIPPAEPFEPSTELTESGFRVAAVSRTKPRLSEEEVQRRIGSDRIQALPSRIDTLYDKIVGGAITDNAAASDAMLYLRKARDKDLEDPRQFDEAEYLVNVAHYFVTRSEQVRQWSYSYGVLILMYGLVWLAVFAAGLIFNSALLTWIGTFTSVPAGATSMTAVFPAYVTTLAGGVGGVLSLMYSLYKHVTARDFDRQFVLWYIMQPFLGIIMGFIVHLFLVAGIFQIIRAEGPTFETIGAIAAIAAAFRPHYVYGWLEWLLQAIRPGGREAGEAPSVAGAAAAPTPSAEPPGAESEPAGVG